MEAAGFLPISKGDATASFEIIIPVLVGQLTIIFRWFGDNSFEKRNARIDLPRWIIIGPPLIVCVIIIISIIVLILGNRSEKPDAGISGDTFKAKVTFCVTILNATTIFIVAKYFKASTAA